MTDQKSALDFDQTESLALFCVTKNSSSHFYHELCVEILLDIRICVLL